MINVLADQNLYQLPYFLPSRIQLRKFDPANGLPDNWNQHDALLIRTVTAIDERLFADKKSGRLSFVGSGSAGHDHVDLSLLQERDIAFAHAPGCNARAVAEYVITSLLIWSSHNGVPLRDLQIGIIGAGHVGSALGGLLDRFDIQYRFYDPPREKRENDFTSCNLETLLRSDILTFHTPLNREGPHPTHHWLDQERLKRRSYKMIINTARGGVVDEHALLQAYKEGSIEAYVLDVWENEARFKDDSARNAFIRTPHIAGYSRQAKLRASRMICESLADHFELTDPPAIPQSAVDRNELPDWERFPDIAEVLQRLHPLIKYQEALDRLIGLPADQKEEKFARIRTKPEYRNEYAYIRVPHRLLQNFPVLRTLDIQSF